MKGRLLQRWEKIRGSSSLMMIAGYAAYTIELKFASTDCGSAGYGWQGARALANSKALSLVQVGGARFC